MLVLTITWPGPATETYAFRPRTEGTLEFGLKFSSHENRVNLEWEEKDWSLVVGENLSGSLYDGDPFSHVDLRDWSEDEVSAHNAGRNYGVIRILS